MNIHMNLRKISNITVLKIESWPGQQGHFTKVWEMAVLLIFLPQFLSILSNLVLTKIGARFW
jgi:hypothetical protein